MQISAKSEKSNLKTKAGREKLAPVDSEFYNFTKVTTGGEEKAWQLQIILIEYTHEVHLEAVHVQEQ